MLRGDLEAAGVAYVHDRGRVLDFHGLRHSFVTNLSHAPSRVAQSLARHKTSAMTDRYTHVRLNDERAALEMLPDLTARPSDEQARATGTDGGSAADQQPCLIHRIHASEDGVRFGALRGQTADDSCNPPKQQNRVLGIENAVFERGRRVSNPQPSDRQSDALTN